MADSRPVLSEDSYRRFVAFMFSAAMVGWTLTWVRFIHRVGAAVPDVSLPFAMPSPYIATIAGSIFGIALVCLYWLFIERIARRLAPCGMVAFLGDFLILGLLVLGANTWDSDRAFVLLALACVMSLGVRIHVRTSNDALMTHLLYLSIGVALFLLTVVAVILFYHFDALVKETSNTRIIERSWELGYYIVILGLVVGIYIVLMHSQRHTPSQDKDKNKVSDESKHWQPALIPAYWHPDPVASKAVVKAVMTGEMDYFRMIGHVRDEGFPDVRADSSRVHAFRDVERQAYVLALASIDARVTPWYAFWVYTAHWLDDVLDGPGADSVSQDVIDGKGQFDLHQVLERANPAALAVWKRARAMTEGAWRRWSHETAEIGIRRLVLSSVIYSARTPEIEAMGYAFYRRHILDWLKDQDIRALLERMPPDLLALSSKVPLEIWEAFREDRSVEYSTLLGVLLSPAVMYHDAEEEARQGELIDQRDAYGRVKGFLDDEMRAIVEAMASRFPERLPHTVIVLRAFIDVFRTVLSSKGLLSRYEDLLKQLETK